MLFQHLASPRTSFSWTPTDNPLWVGIGVCGTGWRMILQFYGHGLVLRVSMGSFTDMEYSLSCVF
jgi:hypothetical protein